MQSTLNAVEITAQSSTHVFGESHARALDDLREAQILLARAWGRGNDEQQQNSTGQDETSSPTDTANERAEHDGEISAGVNLQGFKLDADERRRARAGTDTSVASTASTALTGESEETEHATRSPVSGSGAGHKSRRANMEDETAQDVRRANERRAANEAYFRKVESSVQDVVKRLEGVAAAMRAVESESRSLWSASDSPTTASNTRSPSASVLDGGPTSAGAIME